MLADMAVCLGYEKGILATDADVDRMHIRNLMITYFFKFFEQLVQGSHVWFWKHQCSARLRTATSVGQRVLPVSVLKNFRLVAPLRV